jgi:beta-glucosidase
MDHVQAFDNPMASADGLDGLDSPAHRTLAREGAEQGIVLLKNSGGKLPIAAAKLAGLKVGLFGPLASKEGGPDAADALVGSYVLSGAEVVTFDVSLGKLMASGSGTLNWTEGCSRTIPGSVPCPGAAGAAAQAAASDVAIVVVGVRKRALVMGAWCLASAG